MNPVVVRYEINSPKVKDEMKLLFCADLHGVSYGEGNADLIDLCRELAPDLILLGGDMITCRHRESYRTAAHFIKALTRIAPVFAVNGNHETCADQSSIAVSGLFHKYISWLEKAGVSFVNDTYKPLMIKDSAVVIGGFEAPLRTYRKFEPPQLKTVSVPAAPEEGDFTVLLAHSPAFARAYLASGADLILSGHYHGGVMRFGKHGVLASPYGFPLPRYGYGHYRKDSRHMIVTAGLGDHAIPFRVNNLCEIVLITVKPA